MRICLVYQVVYYHKNEDSEEYAQTSYEALLIRPYSDLAYTKVLGVTSQYILKSGSLWYPLRSSMLENKRIFSLVISKVMPDFSAVQLDEAKNHII